MERRKKKVRIVTPNTQKLRSIVFKKKERSETFNNFWQQWQQWMKSSSQTDIPDYIDGIIHAMDIEERVVVQHELANMDIKSKSKELKIAQYSFIKKNKNMLMQQEIRSALVDNLADVDL
jgi:enoyl-[acyl-carrier-protein] reductase (NADH)